MSKKTASIFSVNAQGLRTILLDEGLSTSDAAKRCGVGVDLVGRLIRGNRPISIRTASLLRRAFGDKVIVIDGDE